jgi:predicted negative regulator of RcsB-dependent stress response
MNRLRSQYARTPYAILGSLAFASELAQGNDAKAAVGHLQWAESYGKDGKLRRIASLRKARLLWSQGDVEGALASLTIKKKDPFAPLIAELRGDILLSEGKRADARAAYQAALDLSPENAARAQVQQKLDDLADVQPAAPAPQG